MKAQDKHYGPAARIRGDTNDEIGPDNPTEFVDFMEFYGRVIQQITVKDTQVLIEFKNGTACAFVSDEPDCCARHYMMTDDKVEEHVGAKLLGVVVKLSSKTHGNDEDGYGVLETMFFDVNTTKGTLNCRSHNSHNGYYGGVGVNFKVVRSLKSKGVFRE